MEIEFIWLKGANFWGKDVYSATLGGNKAGSSGWWSAPYGDMVYSIALGSQGLHYVYNTVDKHRAIRGSSIPNFTYHYMPPVSADGSPVPAPEPTYNPSPRYYQQSWIEYVDIRRQSGNEVFFFGGRYEADNLGECVVVSSIYRIVEIEPKISPGEWPIPPYAKGMPYHGPNGSAFTFDEDDGLYISHGCGPSSIFLISHAGPESVTGQTSKIFDDQSNIISLRSYGPGILYFLSHDDEQGWRILELDLVNMGESKVVYSTAADPTFVDVLDFALTPPTQTMMSRLDIQWIQRALNRILGIALQIDGVYGTSTKDAIRQFQVAFGLTPDGIVGPRTRGEIIEQVRAQ